MGKRHRVEDKNRQRKSNIYSEHNIFLLSKAGFLLKRNNPCNPKLYVPCVSLGGTATVLLIQRLIWFQSVSKEVFRSEKCTAAEAHYA